MKPFVYLEYSSEGWIRHLQKRFFDLPMIRIASDEGSCPGVLLIHSLDPANIAIPSDPDVAQAIPSIGKIGPCLICQKINGLNDFNILQCRAILLDFYVEGYNISNNYIPCSQYDRNGPNSFSINNAM